VQAYTAHGYSKSQKRTAVGSYSMARPRSVRPPRG
jgi:hypothetical protein